MILCDYGCGQPATCVFKNGKNCCSILTKCPGNRKKNSTGLKKAYADGTKKVCVDQFIGKRPPYISAIDYSERVMGKPGRSHRFTIKTKLIREGILEKKCISCDLDTWLGEELPLRLDHIDGDCGNFAIDNLRLLCGNCDSLQDTFAHKNVGRKHKIGGKHPRGW